MKTSVTPNYLFVYGTLRKEFGLQLSKELKDDIKFVCSAVINGELYDIGEYPAALPSPDENSKIAGEIYEVSHPRKTFRILDEYEGYDKQHLRKSEYLRKRETIVLQNGETINAWVYWYNLPVNSKKRIYQRDYLQYLKNKRA